MISIITLSLFLFSPVFAAEQQVVINEIYAPGTPDWVELYNPSNEKIDITRWKLLDNSTTAIIKTFSADTTIGPKDFLVIEVSNRLNNDGDRVKLIDQNGIELSQFEYTTTSENKSFARIPDGSGSWFGNRNPTKGTTNGTVPPKIDPTEKLRTGNIILSEFMPNPDGGKEWVEVYNPNSFTISIVGWKIDDIEGASSPFTIPDETKINARSYKIFSFSSKLNNSGDSLRLIKPGGAVAEVYDFQDTTKGASFAKDASGKWQFTLTPTPGVKNIITSSENSNGTINSLGTSSNKESVLESDIQEATASPSFTGDIGNFTSDAEGKVAGISSTILKRSGLSTLFVVAGISLLFTSVLWPFVEKKLWKRKS